MFIKVTEFDGKLALIPIKGIQSVRMVNSENHFDAVIRESLDRTKCITAIIFNVGYSETIHVCETVDEVYKDIERAVNISK